jgi:hypothetical protein
MQMLSMSEDEVASALSSLHIRLEKKSVFNTPFKLAERVADIFTNKDTSPRIRLACLSIIEAYTGVMGFEMEVGTKEVANTILSFDITPQAPVRLITLILYHLTWNMDPKNYVKNSSAVQDKLWRSLIAHTEGWSENQVVHILFTIEQIRPGKHTNPSAHTAFIVAKTLHIFLKKFSHAKEVVTRVEKCIQDLKKIDSKWNAIFSQACDP